MKIEFLATGSADCPLIRLFDYVVDELEHLRKICRELADGERVEFILHDQPWVEAMGECRFVWRAGSRDLGVRLPNQSEPFVLEYSDEAWREVEDKLRPFIEGSSGFNWLTNEGEVNVLISRHGTW